MNEISKTIDAVGLLPPLALMVLLGLGAFALAAYTIYVVTRSGR